MKKIVRKSVFETNSSSAHSLSLAKCDQEFVMDTIYPDQDGVILVKGEEFGWAWLKFNDAMTKLAYLMQDQGSSHMDEIIEVVKEQTGALEVIFDENGGYIDHESYGTAYEACHSKDSIKNFIFNKNSWLFTGNDNSRPDPTFYDVPEFKAGRQIMPKYKFQLVIKGCDKTTKYMHKPSDEELEQGIDSILDGALLTKDGDFIFENSIYFQMSRPRDFYTKEYGVDQDYSTGEVRFLKENDFRFNDIRNEIDIDKKLDYHIRFKLITERALAVPGLVKRVKFELQPIVATFELKD
jgi:hypothetical protein